MPSDAVERARALVGTRFRAQGRDPRYGLDCIGLAMLTYRTEGGRSDYRLSGDYRRELEAGLARDFRRVKQARPGDLMLVRIAENQYHLAVRTDAGFVHADARRRLVVETPGEPEWPVLGIYRKRMRGMR